jgi:hypothetical protein
MNRRGFLVMLAGAVLDPERLLWVPGKKLISIPAPRKLDPFPFGVISVYPGGLACARVLQQLLNHRWQNDPAWRKQAQNQIDRGMEQAILWDEMQVATGYFRELPPAKVPQRRYNGLNSFRVEALSPFPLPSAHTL